MASSGSFSKDIYGGAHKLRVDWSSTQSVDNNTSVITAKVYLVDNYAISIGARTGNTVKIAGKSYSFSSPAVSSTGTHLLATITSDAISHNTDGTKSVAISCSFNLNATIAGTYYGAVTASDTVTLPTIPRASSFTASNGTLGTEQTIQVTKASSGFTHTITYKCGGVSGTICSKATGTSVKWTPDMELAKQNTTGTSVSVTLTLQTYNGSSAIGKAVTLNISQSIPASVKPSLSLSLSDPTGNRTKYGVYVQNQSKLQVSLNITNSYGATIKSYSVKVGTQSVTTNGGTFSLPSSRTVSVSATVKDSRGRTATATSSVSVTAYKEPKISSLTVYRCNASGTAQNDGAFFRAKFSATVTNVNSKNTATYKIAYRETGTSSWTKTTLSALANQLTVTNSLTAATAANTAKAYDVRIEVTDGFKTITSVIKAVPIAFVLVQATADGTGIAFGQQATESGVMGLGIPLKFGNQDVFSQFLHSVGHYHIDPFSGSKSITINTLHTTLLIFVGASGSDKKAGCWYVISNQDSAAVSAIKTSSVVTVTAKSSGVGVTINNTDKDSEDKPVTHSIDIICLGTPSTNYITIS